MHGIYGVYTLDSFITVRVPEELKRKMKEFNYINWSEVVRKAIEERVTIEERRKLREQAAKAMDEIRDRLLRDYGPTNYDSAEVIRFWRDLRR